MPTFDELREAYAMRTVTVPDAIDVVVAGVSTPVTIGVVLFGVGNVRAVVAGLARRSVRHTIAVPVGFYVGQAAASVANFAERAVEITVVVPVARGRDRQAELVAEEFAGKIVDQRAIDAGIHIRLAEVADNV